MTIVALPNGEELEFPVEATPQQMKDYIAKNYPQFSKAQQFGAGVQAQVDQQPDSIAMQIARPLAVAGKGIAQGVIGGVADTARAATDFPRALIAKGVEAAGFPETAYDIAPPAQYPSEQIGQLIDKATGGLTAPRNNFERFTQGATELAASVLTPASSPAARQTAMETLGLIKKSIRPTDQITASQVRKVASEFYRLADEQGGVLKPNITNKFVAEIESMAPQTEAGKLLAGDTDFTKLVERIKGLTDSPLTLQAAQEVDELLGDLVSKNTDMGRLTKEGLKISKIQDALRDQILKSSASDVVGGKSGFDSLKQGRKLWATSRKLDDIERVIMRAEMMDNPATGIKNGFRTLAMNPKKMAQYTKSERKLILDAAKSGIVSDALRTVFGSRLLSIFNVASGNPVLAAASMVGNVGARTAAEKLQLRKADKVAQEILRSSGLITKQPTTREVLKQIIQ